MKREPVEVPGIGGELYVSGLKLSCRLAWEEAVQKNKHTMIPQLLHYCIVNSEGMNIKSADEWDEWGAENFSAAADLFHRCIEMIGTTEEAKKK